MPRREGALSKEGRALPARFGPVGKTLAVGLAALVAEAGLLWLRHRDGRAGRLRVRGTGSSPPERFVERGFEEVLVWVQEGDLRGRGFARRKVRAFGVAEPDDG